MTKSDEVKRLEMSKILFDLLKHVATLSSGSILVLVTVADKVLGNNTYPWQLKWTLWLFVSAILSSFTAMIVVSFGVGPRGMKQPEVRWFSAAFLVTTFLFTAAFIFLAALATSR